MDRGAPRQRPVSHSGAHRHALIAGCLTRQPPRRPGPREVVAADWPERVEHLATQEQTPVPLALERARVHLIERHASAGNLCLAEALITGPWQDVRRQTIDESGSLVAPQIGDA